MSFERSYSIESHERIKLILIFADKKPTFEMVGHISLKQRDTVQHTHTHIHTHTHTHISLLSYY